MGQGLRVNVNAESGDYTDFFRQASGPEKIGWLVGETYRDLAGGSSAGIALVLVWLPRRAHLTAVIEDENEKDRTYRTYRTNETYEFVVTECSRQMNLLDSDCRSRA